METRRGKHDAPRGGETIGGERTVKIGRGKDWNERLERALEGKFGKGECGKLEKERQKEDWKETTDNKAGRGGGKTTMEGGPRTDCGKKDWES